MSAAAALAGLTFFGQGKLESVSRVQRGTTVTLSAQTSDGLNIAWSVHVENAALRALMDEIESAIRTRIMENLK